MQIGTFSGQRRATLGRLPDLAWAIGRELMLVTAIQLVVFAALVVFNMLSSTTPSSVAQLSSGLYVYVLFKGVQSFRSRPASRS